MAQYYKVNSEDISYRVVDQEVIILNLKTGDYYSLNKVGTFIWRFLLNKADLDFLVDKVVDEFEIDKKVAIRDITTLLKELISEKMILQADE